MNPIQMRSLLVKPKCQAYLIMLMESIQLNSCSQYKLNYNEGDTLELDIEKKWGIKGFDAFIFNPPYQAVSENYVSKGGGNNLYFDNIIIEAISSSTSTNPIKKSIHSFSSNIILAYEAILKEFASIYALSLPILESLEIKVRANPRELFFSNFESTPIVKLLLLYMSSFNISLLILIFPFPMLPLVQIAKLSNKFLSLLKK